MKTIAFLLFLTSTGLLSCSKDHSVPLSDNQSVIIPVKYPCGPSCTGLAWVVETPGGTFEPVNLPTAFQQYQLPVRISYYRTGKVADPYKGTGEELINIVSIEKR